MQPTTATISSYLQTLVSSDFYFNRENSISILNTQEARATTISNDIYNQNSLAKFVSKKADDSKSQVVNESIVKLLNLKKHLMTCWKLMIYKI